MATIYDGLKGIPIDYLVSAPLMAAARSNVALAKVMEDFIYAVGFEKDAEGKPTDKTLLITFNLQRPWQNPDTGEWDTQEITVSCPMIGLVPIPALLVDNVTIDFTTEVSSTSSSSSDVSASMDASYGFGAFKVSGSVTTASSRQRSSNQSAAYTFHVQADQQPATEGMGKLMDVMAACIVPMEGDGGGGGGAS